MDTQDLLLTTAELSVAFAGFSSLVGVFARRRDERIDQHVVNSLRIMLDYALITLFSCLIPFLPMLAGASEVRVWQFSSGAWIAGGLTYWFFNRAFLRELGNDPIYGPVLGRIARVLDTASVVALAGNALGIFWEPSLLVYYSVLLWFLAGAAIGFVLVVSSTWSGPAAQQAVEPDVE
jgi:hypothetical protein